MLSKVTKIGVPENKPKIIWILLLLVRFGRSYGEEQLPRGYLDFVLAQLGNCICLLFFRGGHFVCSGSYFGEGLCGHVNFGISYLAEVPHQTPPCQIFTGGRLCRRAPKLNDIYIYIYIYISKYIYIG